MNYRHKYMKKVLRTIYKKEVQLALHMVLIFTFLKLCRQRMWMCSWQLQKVLVIWCEELMKKVLEFRLYLLYSKIIRKKQLMLRKLILLVLVVQEQAYWKQPSKKKQKRTYSESKQCFVVDCPAL